MNIHRWRKLEVIWRILTISFKTGKQLLSIYQFFFSREVIQVRMKWSKRFKLYKDDLYRRLKRFVWYVVSLFRARVCVRGAHENRSSLTSSLGVSTSRADAARNRGQYCTWKYLSIARDFNRLFCSNKIYSFTRRKVHFQCSPQVHSGSLTGNILGRPDSRLGLLVAKNKKSMGLFSPKFALNEERTWILRTLTYLRVLLFAMPLRLIPTLCKNSFFCFGGKLSVKKPFAVGEFLFFDSSFVILRWWKKNSLFKKKRNFTWNLSKSSLDNQDQK